MTQIVALLQALFAAANQVVTAKSTWHDAVVANATLEAHNAPILAELKQMILAMYSNAETTLAQFGLTPKKVRTPLTVAQKASRNAKAASTRLARGTTGKKKKAAITGNVTGVQIVPVTTSTGAATASTASAPIVTPVAVPVPAATVPAGAGGTSVVGAVVTAPATHT